MQSVRIGIQTRSLRLPLRKALETAAQLGADGVEIDARQELVPAELSQTGLRQFRKILDDLQLEVSAVAFPTRRGYEVTDQLDRRVQATQVAMRLAHELGASVVVNRVGTIPENESDLRFSQLVEVLSGFAAFGERVGARLAAQTGSENGTALAKLLAALPGQSVGVDFHPAALIRHGYDPAETLAAIGPSVLHVHACDAVRDLTRGQAFEVELGRGTADLPGLLGGLEEFSYRGWITIERHDAADPVSEIGNAVAYLRSLV